MTLRVFDSNDTIGSGVVIDTEVDIEVISGQRTSWIVIHRPAVPNENVCYLILTIQINYVVKVSNSNVAENFISLVGIVSLESKAATI